MNIENKIKGLYGKGTKESFDNLLELEAISEQVDIVYPYFNEFLAMLKSEKYLFRVRGFRLICKLAKWDKDNLIDEALEDVLVLLHDEKPTAIRQALGYLKYLITYKEPLKGRIREAALAIDLSEFKDSMRPLIEKDIGELVRLIDGE